MAENWYKTGEEGFRAKDQIDAANEMRKERGVPRFMLKAGEEAPIVFVDDVPFFIWEHNLEIGNRFGNYVTCVKEHKACDVCATGKKSTYTGYLTCIDLRTFIKKDGTKVTKRKILYPAKGSTIKRLEHLKKKHGTLAGHVFVVKRFTKDDPNCGTDFDFKKAVNLTGEYAEKINYAKILAPMTPEELAQFGIKSSVVGRQTGTLEDVNKEVTPTSEEKQSDDFGDLF